MPGMQFSMLDFPRFLFSAFEPFTKNKVIVQKLKETRDLIHIYGKEQDEACFQHDTVYGDFQDSPRGTASDKLLRDKAFNIAKNPKYDGYQLEIASMVYIVFDKKSVSSSIKDEIFSNHCLLDLVCELKALDRTR